MLMDLYNQNKLKQLTALIAIALMFETMYCIASINLFSLINENLHFQNTIRIISCVFIFFMGIWMLVDTKKNYPSTKNTIRRGVLSIIIHPQQLLFWLIFSHLINSYTPLFGNPSSILWLAFYNCVGALCIFCVYMITGPSILNYFKLNLQKLNAMVGFTYIVLALFNTINLFMVY